MNDNNPVPPAQDGAGQDDGAQHDPAQHDPAQQVAVDRLRAADPAVAATPDGAALRAAVDDRVAAGRTDELAAARARRWTSWPARVAGVAAAALVIGGGGGYAVGAAGAGQQVVATEQGAGAESDSAASEESEESTESGPAAPESMPMPETPPEMGITRPGAGDEAGFWPGSGRTVFTASGLSEEGGTGTAWGFDPAGAFSAESIASVARALGVEGEPVLQDESWWSVGPMDGSGPNVTLQSDGMASVGYYDPTKDPWSCPTAAIAEDAGSEATEGGGEDPATSMIAPEPCEQRDLGDAPAGEAALAAARDVLASLGQDPASFELTADTWEPAWTSVTAALLIDGSPSGVMWNLTFTGAGLQNLYGTLAPLVPLGDYAVVSPAEAVDRLTDPRFGGGWGGPIAYAEGAEPLAEQSGVPAGPATRPAPQPGGTISWPVQDVTIVEARLVSAMTYQPDGSSMLLPTYELVSEDGGIWTVLAVAEQHLDFTAVD